ncbi:MAG: proliferating cell nuclear antigen (pcna) [Candidatus Woesearchaeota archaeon]
MRLTLAEPKYLKDSISIISELVNEARFKVTKDAIELVAMDPANVAMVIFKLFSSTFTEYDLKEETEIGLNLDNLKQVLRRASPSDMITLQLGEDNRLMIQLKGTSTRTFSIPTIDLDEKDQKIPDLKFGAKLTTSASIFNEAIEDADIVAESVSFIAQPKKMVIVAEGDLSKANIEINEDDNTKIEVEGNSKVKSKYSIEYLKKMINGSKIADTVTASFHKDYPLRLDYNTIDKVNLSFILAPRVEND